MKTNAEEKHGKVTLVQVGQGASRKPARRADNWRETIESIVVAFVLAFLFRTFEAEAFVIPTGSMAPTLYGQHRDVYCEQCGTRFAAGVNSSSSDAEVSDGVIIPGFRSHFAVCPNANCRFPNNVLEDEIFAGDRILVNKFPYEFKNPERWDVVVFKFPEQARTNYIKRLAGMPGEELKIEGGNVWVRPLNKPEAEFAIARKSPEKQRRLQLPVHDNDHPARAAQCRVARKLGQCGDDRLGRPTRRPAVSRSKAIPPMPKPGTGCGTRITCRALPTGTSSAPKNLSRDARGRS